MIGHENAGLAESLRNPDEARDYYDDRYGRGYMDDCSTFKKAVIRELILTLPLPGVGKAIDFGCGQGFLAGALRETLPESWQVLGTDLSEKALEFARHRFPECRFLSLPKAVQETESYDLLLSHHVLEHAYDVDAVLTEVERLLKKGGIALIVLPCGNEGSLEYRLCAARRGGLQTARGNRFFFEDESHLRRFRTEEFVHIMRRHGFEIVWAKHGHQFWASIDWITRTDSTCIRDLTAPGYAVGERDRSWLRKWRLIFLVIWACRHIVRVVARKRQQARTAMVVVQLILLWLPVQVCSLVERFIDAMSVGEWKCRQDQDPGGSEMFLCFRKQRGATK